jgi:hypothetical protein
MITLEMMPPLMFGGLILAMLIGFPVAFTLAALGLSFGFLSIYLGFFDMNFLQAIPGRIFGSVLSNELLLAIPFFTFMGAILERCGLAHRCDLGCAVKLGQSETRRVRLNPEIDRAIANFTHVVRQGLEDAKQRVESAGVFHFYSRHVGAIARELIAHPAGDIHADDEVNAVFGKHVCWQIIEHATINQGHAVAQNGSGDDRQVNAFEDRADCVPFPAHHGAHLHQIDGNGMKRNL